MKFYRGAIAAAALLLSFGAGAHAQTTLRIGLAEDPDILDPTLARTYVGRIVFAAFCDKLFDIDEKLNIVPQLALSLRDLRRRQGGHHQAAAGRQIPGRRTVRRRGRQILARAPPDACRARSANRNWPRVDHVDVVDPLTIKLVLKTPFSPLIAQLTDRAGMMVSPKAAKEEGDKFGLHPVCAGPYKFVERVQQDRIVFEKFADYWNKDNVHHRPHRVSADRRCHGAARQSEIRRPRSDRARAGDRHQGRARRPEAQAVERDRARLSWASRINIGNGQDQGPAEPVRQGAAGARSVDRPRGHQPGRVQRRVHAGQPVGQSRSSLLPEGLSGPPARRRQGQGAAEGGRRHDAGARRFHGAEGRRDRGGRAGDSVDGGRSRLRPEDPGHRVRDLAQAGRGRRIPGLSCSTGAAGSIPTAIPTSS